MSSKSEIIEQLKIHIHYAGHPEDKRNLELKLEQVMGEPDIKKTVGATKAAATAAAADAARQDQPTRDA